MSFITSQNEFWKWLLVSCHPPRYYMLCIIAFCRGVRSLLYTLYHLSDKKALKNLVRLHRQSEKWKMENEKIFR